MKLPAAERVKLEDINIEYERFFSFSVDMLCISSYDGYFKKVNPAFEKVLGFSAEELCTKSYLDFIHPDDIESTRLEVEKQLLTHQQVISFENRYRNKDGSYRWLSWNSAPVGQFMYAVARDVTQSKLANEELKKTKEVLEAVNQELEAFSYSVAHDLRAPLRSIIGFTTLIFEETESSLAESVKIHLSKVISAARKMGILVEGLLNLARLSRKEIIKQSVDLSSMAKEFSEELLSSDSQRDVEFLITENLVAEGDPVLLKAVIENLFGNAWKYSSKSAHKTTIEFGFQRQEGQRVFFVRDNGIGFDMIYANQLFGVFQRLHSDKEFEGTGIGLAMVQKIIQRHGGKIWAQAALNEGATFFFTL